MQEGLIDDSQNGIFRFETFRQEQYHPEDGRFAHAQVAFSRCETLKYVQCCPEMRLIC